MLQNLAARGIVKSQKKKLLWRWCRPLMSKISLSFSPETYWLHLVLRGKGFATVEEVETAWQEALNNLKLQHFHRCFSAKKRLDKCTA
jgi:hypothetical protein